MKKVIGIAFLFLLFCGVVLAEAPDKDKEVDFFSLDDYYQFLKDEEGRKEKLKGQFGFKRISSEDLTEVGVVCIKPIDENRAIELEFLGGEVEFLRGEVELLGVKPPVWREYASRVYSLSFGMRSYLSNSISQSRFYIGAKGSFYHITPESWQNDSEENVDNVFGICGFAGGCYSAQNISLFGDLGYRKVKEAKFSKIDLSGFVYSLGASIRF